MLSELSRSCSKTETRTNIFVYIHVKLLLDKPHCSIRGKLFFFFFNDDDDDDAGIEFESCYTRYMYEEYYIYTGISLPLSNEERNDEEDVDSGSCYNLRTKSSVRERAGLSHR